MAKKISKKEMVGHIVTREVIKTQQETQFESLISDLTETKAKLKDLEYHYGQIINSRKWKLVRKVDYGVNKIFSYSKILRKIFHFGKTTSKGVFTTVMITFRVLKSKIKKVIILLNSWLFTYKSILLSKKFRNQKWPDEIPLVSIVIPCFNYGNYVQHAIDSVLSQTFQNIEVIVVDGGSNDNSTIKILKKTNKPKTRILFRKGRHFAGDNRNYGISMAKGRYICCLDADDMLEPTYIEKGVFYLETYKYDAVCPNVQCFGKKNNIWIAYPTTFEKMLYGNNSVPTVAIFTKSSWEECGGFKDWPIGKGHVPEDWEFWTRMMGHGFRFKSIPEPLFLYRVHSNSMTALDESTVDFQRNVIQKENTKLLTRDNTLIRDKRKNALFKVENPFINIINTQQRIKPTVLVITTCGSFSESDTSFLSHTKKEKNVNVVVINESNEYPIDSSLFKLTQEIYNLSLFTKYQFEKEKFIDYIISSRKIECVYLIGPKSDSLTIRILNKQKLQPEIFETSQRHLPWTTTLSPEKNKIFYSLYDSYYNYHKWPDDIFTLSIVLNLHHEGSLVESTIINLVKSVSFSNNFNLWKNIEIIVILDDCDNITEGYTKKYSDNFSKIYNVYFKDLALSRNYGVEKSKNNFVLFSDGDDYVSIDCLAELYRSTLEHYIPVLKKVGGLSAFDDREHAAFFHKTLVEFPNLYKQIYANSNKFITNNMSFLHYYTSKIMVYRKLLLDHKIRPNTKPYGSEDWDLNNRLLSIGVQYKTANYTLYYRRENKNSLGTIQLSDNRIVRNSRIYQLALESRNRDVVKGIAIKQKFDTRTANFNEDIRFISSHAQEKFSIKSRYEGDFRNHKTFSKELKVYIDIVDFLGEHNFLFLVPWVTVGGADKLIVEHALALKKTSLSPCIITTINAGSRIDQTKTPYLDIGSQVENWNNIDEQTKLHILVKAIINSKVKFIHLIQSDLAFKMLRDYHSVFKEHGIKILVSVFCPDYDWINKKFCGYPVTYSSVLKKSDIVFSDNQYWYAFFKKIAGTDFNFKKLYSPIDTNPNIKIAPTNNKNILWASRICHQKLIKTLYEVCKAMPAHKFVIYGGNPEDEYSQKYFDKIATLHNVKYMGLYKDMTEINVNNYDLYLFTSKFEGLAIVRLDMINHNLPIVSSDVGDSTEIFGKEYKLLVKDVEDPAEYIRKINEYYRSPQKHFQIATKLRLSIVKEHSKKKFRKDYLTSITEIN